MAESMLVNLFGPVLGLVVLWLLPTMNRRTLPFGIRVPAAHADAPVIAAQLRTYRRWILGAGIVVVAAAVGLTYLLPLPVAQGIALVAVVVVWLPAFLRARREIGTVKEREGWYDGLRQGVAADTSLRTEPVRFPWLWAVPAVLLCAATAVLGIVRYPDLPPTLVTHWDLDGTPDRTMTTTVGSAFALVFVQVGMTALLVGLMWASIRFRPDLDAAAPKVSAHQYRGFLLATAKAVLVLAALVDVSMLVIAWQMWGGGARLPAGVVILPILVGTAVVIGSAIRTGQGGSRLPADGEPGAGTAAEDTGLVQRDDDRYWPAGSVYVNRADPAMFVPKRLGVGWTVNFGNPKGIALFAAILLAPLLLTVVLR
ncbi:DUF5808 domain-containing protein [Actinopolymorpha sp. NPDC004070]|uniref:DUF1648 domain-containing protein n=1 Tax=Actinopolymorpha sp. NPDC004070 TaxID=3154548 RepID=UPI0033B21312